MTIAPIAVGVFMVAFACGSYHTQSKYEAKIKEMEATYAQAVIDAQLEEKKKYEAKQEDLLRRFNDDARHHAERVRQLEAKLQSRGDVETITRERDDCLGLAVRGERLLQRADAIIESLER